MEVDWTAFSMSIIISFVFLNLLVSIRKKRESPKIPPGPWKLPIIGNLHQLVGSLPHRRLRDLANKYGPLMHLQIGQISTVVVSSSEMAEKIMKTHDLIFASRPHNLAAGIFTYNYSDIAFAPYGEYWRQLKKICTVELLSAKQVTSFRSIREEEVSDLIKWIGSRAGSPINLSQKISSLQYGVICRAAFGKRGEDEDKYLSFLAEISKFLGGFNAADLFPSIEGFLFWVTGIKSKMEKVQSEADRIIQSIIDEHRRRKNMTTFEDENLIDVLLRVQENGDVGFRLTDDNIKAVISEIINAGSESTSTVIDWAMSELMNNPACMKKVQTEVRQVFNKFKKFDETGIAYMKYLKAVIKETLRLHPPGVLLVPRECSERCRINGFEIPLKTSVIINVCAIGRDSNYWTNPDSFIPERFLDCHPPIDYKGSDFQLLPFGAGRRICPGISFAAAVVELSLAMLLYYFDWKHPNEINCQELDMSEKFGISIRRKKDLWLIPTAYHP